MFFFVCMYVCMNICMYVWYVYLFYVLSLCLSDRMDGLPSIGLLRKATSGPSRLSWAGGQTSRPGTRYAYAAITILDLNVEVCMYVCMWYQSLIVIAHNVSMYSNCMCLV